MDCSLPDSSVNGILQEIILECIAISSYKGFSTKTTESENEYGGWGVDYEPGCNAGDPGSIPGSGRSSGEGIGHPLWYS